MPRRTSFPLPDNRTENNDAAQNLIKKSTDLLVYQFVNFSHQNIFAVLTLTYTVFEEVQGPVGSFSNAL